MTIDVLDTGTWTPQQAILQVTNDIPNITKCVVLYMQKGEEVPRVTASSMDAVDLHFFGFALQTFALRKMEPHE